MPHSETMLDVRGTRMELIFEGHDNPECGGISELQVFAAAA